MNEELVQKKLRSLVRFPLGKSVASLVLVDNYMYTYATQQHKVLSVFKKREW